MNADTNYTQSPKDDLMIMCKIRIENEIVKGNSKTNETNDEFETRTLVCSMLYARMLNGLTKKIEDK